MEEPEPQRNPSGGRDPEPDETTERLQAAITGSLVGAVAANLEDTALPAATLTIIGVATFLALGYLSKQSKLPPLWKTQIQNYSVKAGIMAATMNITLTAVQIAMIFL